MFLFQHEWPPLAFCALSKWVILCKGWSSSLANWALFLSPSDIDRSLHKLQQSQYHHSRVDSFTIGLVFTTDKTEAYIKVAGVMVTPSDHIKVKRLGVTLDRRLSFNEHVSSVCTVLHTLFPYPDSSSYPHQSRYQEQQACIACATAASSKILLISSLTASDCHFKTFKYLYSFITGQSSCNNSIIT